MFPSVHFTSMFDILRRICTVAHKYNTPLIWTSLLCQVVFLLCWGLFGSSKHFSSMPSGFSAMLSIFLSFWAVFPLCQAVFSYAEPFSALPTIFLLCRAVQAKQKNTRQSRKTTEKPLNREEKRLEELKSDQDSWNMLGRAEKNAQHSWKMLGKAEIPLSIEEKWLEEPRSA